MIVIYAHAFLSPPLAWTARLGCCQVKDEALNYLTGVGCGGVGGGGESVGCCLSVCLNDYAAVKRISLRGCRVCRHSSHRGAEPTLPGRHIIRTSLFSMTLLRESHWLLLKPPVFCKKQQPSRQTIIPFVSLNFFVLLHSLYALH